MQLKVTQEDIEKGKKGNPTSCPIARAIRRVLPRKRIHVSDYKGIKINGKYYGYTPTINRFIRSFDQGRKVKPFTFELSI